MTACFSDEQAHSSDEMMSNLKERIHCTNNLKKSLSGSLPSIVADPCKPTYSIIFIYSNLDCKQATWHQENLNETPSTSNPLLNKSMITSTIGIDGSDGDFQVLRVPTIAGDTSSEHSLCSDKGKYLLLCIFMKLFSSQ
jgi:hypothetical protein